MSFNAKSVAFYLLHCILLVGCVAPPQVHPAAFQPTVNATSVVTSTKLPDTVLQTASGRIPTTGESGLTNQTGSNVTSYGTGHVQPANEKNKDHTAPDSVASKTNVNLPGKNGVTGNATTVPTTLAPPHKKTHRPTNTSQHYVAVPINSASKSDNIIEDFAHPDSVPRPLRASEKFNPTFGAIVAAISITMAVGGYVVLMAWRKIEMDRYGNRQMLINEDDFGDIQDEDMRHFEASCIQIDP